MTRDTFKAKGTPPDNARLIELLRFAYERLEYIEDEGPTGYGWTSEAVTDWCAEVKPLIE